MSRYRDVSLGVFGGAWLGAVGMYVLIGGQTPQAPPGEVTPSHVHGPEANGHTHSHNAGHRHAAVINDPSLPEWARLTAQLHGGLGPWAISGAIAGRHARETLALGAGESLDVIYLIPEERRSPGTMCVIDGLQVGSGATAGKQAVSASYIDALDHSHEPPAHAERGIATVFRVVAADGSIARAVRYTPSPTLLSILHEGSLESLAADAKRIIAMDPEDLFIIEPIDRELASKIDSDMNNL